MKPTLEEYVTNLKAENKKFREALSFYANPATWENGQYRTVEGDTFDDAPPFIYDMGDKAQIALNGVTEYERRTTF